MITAISMISWPFIMDFPAHLLHAPPSKHGIMALFPSSGTAFGKPGGDLHVNEDNSVYAWFSFLLWLWRLVKTYKRKSNNLLFFVSFNLSFSFSEFDIRLYIKATTFAPLFPRAGGGKARLALFEKRGMPVVSLPSQLVLWMGATVVCAYVTLFVHFAL